MNNGGSLVLGIYAIFIIAVVLAGNGEKLVAMAKEDGSKFLPWLIATFVLTLLAQHEQTRAAVSPIAFLLLLNVALRNYGTIETQVKTILGGITK